MSLTCWERKSINFNFTLLQVHESFEEKDDLFQVNTAAPNNPELGNINEELSSEKPCDERRHSDAGLGDNVVIVKVAVFLFRAYNC